MTVSEWKDPTLVWLRMEQLKQIGLRMTSVRQTGKSELQWQLFQTLQEELFRTAQLLPAPPEKPYYTYTPAISPHAYTYEALGGDWRRVPGIQPVTVQYDDGAYINIPAAIPTIQWDFGDMRGKVANQMAAEAWLARESKRSQLPTLNDLFQHTWLSQDGGRRPGVDTVTVTHPGFKIVEVDQSTIVIPAREGALPMTLMRTETGPV